VVETPILGGSRKEKALSEKEMGFLYSILADYLV